MAPHAEDTQPDTSGYAPERGSIRELRAALRYCHKISVPKSTWLSQQPLVHDVGSDRPKDQHDSCVVQLSLSELTEVEQAVEHFMATNLPLNKMKADCFPLPTLSAKLQRLSTALPHDKPYFLVRGLEPQCYSKERNVVIFTGIASHVGTKRAMAAQDPNVLHHVTNIEKPTGSDGSVYRGPANRTRPIPFHTDYGEIMSLYTLSLPASGGSFYLADIHDIAEHISRSRPDILTTLRTTHTMVHPCAGCHLDERPLLFDLPSGRLAIQASRSRLFGTIDRPRPQSILPLSAQQVEAVNALHAAGQEVAQRIEFRRGDMLFFNNLRMMHARDGFVDGDEEENTTSRYLLRLILKDERNADWEVPPELQMTWDELYNHDDEEERITVLPELFSFKASH